jgi:uncharacterized protein with von Willebrand factor type A (vWA) domain
VAPDSARLAVAFARLLRGAGLDAPVGSVTTFADALALVGLHSRSGVYWAGRTTLVRRSEDVPVYDAAFDAFWLRRGSPDLLTVPVEQVPVVLADDDAAADGGEDGDDEELRPVITMRWSATEVLRHKDFAAYSHAEFAEARRLMADLRLAGALRRSRRLRPGRRPGRPDVRRTLRRALRAGGEPVHRAYLSPSQRPRRVVLLCDVSGSMEPYARALLRFLHAAVASGGRVEAFALGTRLTRLTRELASRDPDAALSRAAHAVLDWSGGTRLGDGLHAFNDQWGTRGMARGAVVVVLSDGWDRGSPELLGTEMARLGRVAHRIIWVNPLKATKGYAPLAQGMAAALPHVDAFIEGHSLAALQELARELGR